MTIAAAVVGIDGDRITDVDLWLGAVAPVPWHAKRAEEVVRGKSPSGALFAKAADAELAAAKPLSEGAYKVKMTRHVIIRALELATSRAKEAGK